MTAIRLMLACLALLSASPAMAQLEGIGEIRLKPGVCSAAKAEPVTVGTLVAAPDAFEGRCVRVLGVVAGSMLYDDHGGYEANMAGGAPTLAVRAGLYGDPRLLSALPEAPTQMEIIGQVSACGRRPFVAGYCHHVADGVILIATQARAPNHEVD